MHACSCSSSADTCIACMHVRCVLHAPGSTEDQAPAAPGSATWPPPMQAPAPPCRPAYGNGGQGKSGSCRSSLWLPKWEQHLQATAPQLNTQASHTGSRDDGRQPSHPSLPCPALPTHPPTQLRQPRPPTWRESRSRRGQRSTSCCRSPQLLSCRSVSCGRPSARLRRRADRLMRSSRRPASTVATRTNCWPGGPCAAAAAAEAPLQPDM
jgi:hypothetical protein